MKTTRLALPALAASTLLAFAQSSIAHPPGHRFGDWSKAEEVTEVNSLAPDGCPIESPDGLSLYIASARSGTLGGMDIWAADRATKDAPFGAPVNLGGPVNSTDMNATANDYCPTPLHGLWLMFVSERPGPETCNAGLSSGDMYLIRHNASSGWGEPRHLGCIETGTGPNSAGGELSPSLITTEKGTFLYFSSNVSGNQDIYVSRLGKDGVFGPPWPVHALNTEYNDQMPNVSADGRELVFSSDRHGDFDVYVSTRRSAHGKWSAPVNLGPNVNDIEGAIETRPSLSRDLKRLYFGRNGDIYSSTRAPLKTRHRRHHHEDD